MFALGKWLVLLWLLLLPAGLTAQQSKARFIYRDLLATDKSCGIFSSYQVKVDEYLKRPNPKVDEYFDQPLDIELLWGNPSVNGASKNAVLQIKLTTPANVKSTYTTRPINVSVVVDRSASMSDFQRMDKVKLALKEFFAKLGKRDFASIVLYDEAASVLLPAQKITDKQAVFKLIDSIPLGTSTNMSGGMVLGYREVMRNYNPEYLNRLIVLTDGIANKGITRPEQLMELSRGYNKEGVDISTIGVGADINSELLWQIAHEGRGLSHFIGDCDSVRNDAVAVFEKEFENLSAIVHNPVLEISCPRQLNLVNVIGFPYTPAKEKAEVALHSMPKSTTQVLLAEFTAEKIRRSEPVFVTVKVTYFDLGRQQQVEVKRNAKLYLIDKANKSTPLFSDYEVEYDYTVGRMAQQLKRAIELSEVNSFAAAYRIILQTLREIDGHSFDRVGANYTGIRNELLRQKTVLEQLEKQGQRIR